jgi:methylmalonyl-CoA mutase, N-terminal domain
MNGGAHTRPDHLAAERARWEKESLRKSALREATTDSGLPLDVLYTPLDISGGDYLERLGFPGEYPFTRGVHPSMYRGQLWTIRQYAGLGTAEQTNGRFRFLLDRGQTGLSVALDLPTQMGFDSDDPEVGEEVGMVGVAIDTVEDMQLMFEGIPLDQVSVNFTANATASIMLAMYLAVAERQGLTGDQLSGTLQNDILKEYIARNAYIFPPGPSLRLIADTILYCNEHVPRFNPISISGYHAREAGATAVQEVAYALAAAIAYVSAVLQRGMPVDTFAPRLSFHFSSQRDLFEEVCKVRAARRIWSGLMRERFGAQNPRSQMMRFFNGGSGASLSHAEPLNNIVRGTLQCLAGALAGAQATHVPSYDEAYDIPSEEAALISVRTQQIIGYESGVAKVVDPLGGSYFIESLTDQLEREVLALLQQIEARGGLVAAIERGDVQRALAERAYDLARQVDDGERVVVGLNAFAVDRPRQQKAAGSRRRQDTRRRQLARLRQVRASRQSAEVDAALAALRAGAEGPENLMPRILDAVRARSTIGEIVNVLRDVFGEYQAPSLV